MIKKIVILLGILIILLLSFTLIYIEYTKSVECWWGVLYPTLSFIAFEDNELNDNIQYASLGLDYFQASKYEDDSTIKYKIGIIEWLNSIFR